MGCKGALEAFDLRHQKIQVCTEKFEEFDARTGEGWIYVLRKSVTDVINARYSYHGCAMEGSCTHLAATITDRASMKATASKT